MLIIFYFEFSGQSIHYLTSLNESVTSKLPLILLQKKLNDLLFETSKMSSVTRRGAGLSIMVHRIVSNDTKKGKVSKQNTFNNLSIIYQLIIILK